MKWNNGKKTASRSLPVQPSQQRSFFYFFQWRISRNMQIHANCNIQIVNWRRHGNGREIPSKREKALDALSVCQKNWKTPLHIGLGAGEWWFFCVLLRWFAEIFPVIRLCFVKLMLKRMCLRFLLCCLWSKALSPLMPEIRWKINLTTFSQRILCGFVAHREEDLHQVCTGSNVFFQAIFGFAPSFGQDIKETRLSSIKNEIQNGWVFSICKCSK